jgi:DNA invertase Pin-like site-specific DNA recombinase
MTKIGYARVACLDGDNLERQITALRDAGCEIVFAEQLSGNAMDRPEFNRALVALNNGDELLMTSIDRLSRDFDIAEKDLAYIAARGATLSTLDGGIFARIFDS